jgi:hypothetical protein
MVTMNVADFAGVSTSVEKPLAPGRAAAVASRPVALSTEDAAFLDGIETALGALGTQTTLAAINTILGATADAASANTTIKAALRQIASTGIPITSGTVTVNGVPTTPATRGIGSSDANTLRTHTTIDAAQLGTLIFGSVPTLSGGNDYSMINNSTPSQALETGAGTGAIGDYLETLVAVVMDPTTCNVQIGDGVAPNWDVIPTNIESGVNTYHISLGIRSKTGSWRIKTAAGVWVLATGRWT